MNKFMRRLLSIFIINREKRHRFANTWGKTRNFGKNNHIIYVGLDGSEKEVSPFSVVQGLNLVFEGDNNILRIHKPFYFEFCDMTLRENEYVEFQATHHRIERAKFCLSPGKNCSLKIGKDFSCMAGLNMAGFDEDNLSVTIGCDCMFSYGVFTRTSDGHTVLDNKTKNPLNFGKNVCIGNHVWAGQYTGFLKGSVVPDDCVVGANSIVTKAFKNPNSILVGIPAKEIKNRGPITWDRRTISQYLADLKKHN